MNQIKCLHIDLRTRSDKKRNCYHQTLSRRWTIQSENHLLKVPETIKRFEPSVLIFEYDYPELHGLHALQRTKVSFPSLPIFMITDYHSEELAVWAFRNGVRDYLRNPVNVEDLFSRVEHLIFLTTAVSVACARANLLPLEPPKQELCPRIAPERCNTAAALDYIEANLPRRITLRSVAECCVLGPHRFSHVFRREHGITFQQFLLRRRIREAQELLSDSGKSVIEIAYMAGFGDLSHFYRTFKRYVGCSPAGYRLRAASLGVISLLVSNEFVGSSKRGSARKPTANCRICEDRSCVLWLDVHRAESRGLSV